MEDDRPGLVPNSPAHEGKHDPARLRFYFIAGHRVFGAVLVVLGFMAMQGVVDWGKDLGKVIAIVGLVEFFVMPLVFARMWRSIPK